MWTPDPAKIVTADQKAAKAEAALKATFQTAIQGHVDSAARSRNYGDGNALAGYRDSTVPAWSAEAQAFIAWRDQVWVYSYAELDKALAGERAVPTAEEFIEELPAIIWPE
jgi:hypothetical protein